MYVGIWDRQGRSCGVGCSSVRLCGFCEGAIRVSTRMSEEDLGRRTHCSAPPGCSAAAGGRWVELLLWLAEL